MGPDAEWGKGRVRELVGQCLSGSPDGFEAVRELIDYLLRLTVMAEHERVRLAGYPGNPNARAIGVRRQPLLLKDGRFLRLILTLSLDDTPDKDPPRRLRFIQRPISIKRIRMRPLIIRFDYIREPTDEHPASHVHVRGSIAEDCADCLPVGKTLDRLHIPTGRITVERSSGCCRTVPRSTTSRLKYATDLAASEDEFERIAHRHRSARSISASSSASRRISSFVS